MIQDSREYKLFDFIFGYNKYDNFLLTLMKKYDVDLLSYMKDDNDVSYYY
jgi:hypothetical protein